jgi:hypothetical protein
MNLMQSKVEGNEGTFPRARFCLQQAHGNRASAGGSTGEPPLKTRTYGVIAVYKSCIRKVR